MRIHLALSLLSFSSFMIGMQEDRSNSFFAKCEEHFKRSEYTKAEACYALKLERAAQKLGAPVADEAEMRRAHINHGETLMALGRFEEGAEEFEHRLGNTAMGRKPLVNPWDGSNPAGETFVVEAEHGLGDTFFTLRSAKALHNLGAIVVMRAQGFMKPILEQQEYINKVVINDQEKAALRFDHDIYTLSLSRYVSNKGLQGVQSYDDIAYPEGYMEPRQDRVEYWQQQLSNDGAKKRFGIVWRASKNVAGEVRHLQRDVPLQDLVDALSEDGTILYSLQSGGHHPITRKEYEERKASNTLGELDELDILDDVSKIKIFDATFDGREVGSFQDTAAIMSIMPTVSVDTSTGMLAGALVGEQKVHILLPHESDWRWGSTKSTTSPFFNKTRLYWQETQGDWSAALRKLKEDI